MSRFNQLISYIALGAPATRRQAPEDLSFIRPEIGFTPKWFHSAIGTDFSEIWHTDPEYRRTSLLKMRDEVDRRFPANSIGRIGNSSGAPDLLTGLFGASSIAAMFGVPIRYEKDQLH